MVITSVISTNQLESDVSYHRLAAVQVVAVVRPERCCICYPRCKLMMLRISDGGYPILTLIHSKQTVTAQLGPKLSPRAYASNLA